VVLRAASWATSVVLAVQIATVWVTLRVSQAHRSARTAANIALAAAALAAVANLFVRGQLVHGTVVSWASGLLYLIAPVSTDSWSVPLIRCHVLLAIFGAVAGLLISLMSPSTTCVEVRTT
jgi:hypothetical protein